MNERDRIGRLPRHGLTAAVFAALLAAGTGASAQDAMPPETARQPLRADPARRVFADFPTAHAPQRPAAPGATITVGNCTDDGPGSLRAAVAAAGDGDTLDLGALTCGTITLETGAIVVRVDNLTLSGAGRDALAIDGNANDRVFVHPALGTLTLRALTVQNGRNRATGFHVAGGGCIAERAYLALEDATVRNCYAGGEGAYGGGIYAYSLTMTNSTLSGNVANGVHEDAGTAAFGGAAFVYSMQLVDSTVSGNRAEHHINPARTSYDIAGGIIAVLGGVIESSTIDSNYSQGRAGGLATFNDIALSNSTLSGNIAASEIGGGLFLRWPSTARITNSTLTGNYAAGGGGAVWFGAADSELTSSIVFGNRAGAGTQANPVFGNLQGSGPVTISGDHNLVGRSAPTVHMAADTLDADPLLGALADNGGPTRTHALQRGSPAIDAGTNPDNLAFDQRGSGYPRVHGTAPDIGAFEQQGLKLAPVPTLSAWVMGILAGLLAVVATVRGARHRGDGVR